MIVNRVKQAFVSYNKMHSSHLSIRAFARITNINRQTLLNIINGNANSISFKNLNKLCKFFNTDTNNLFMFTDGNLHRYTANQKKLMYLKWLYLTEKDAIGSDKK